MTKRLKLGMIGGGQGAFIGAVHRLCARMDDKYEFVAGCLSSTPEKAAKSAKEIGSRELPVQIKSGMNFFSKIMKNISYRI